ncbi:uncharacterized protein [Lepisosteus oculatus]|uniref:uncharacterized protein n=1 Tax=Lepisosteus oculatus TaxID=7918 RepID=UPI0035F4FED9
MSSGVLVGEKFSHCEDAYSFLALRPSNLSAEQLQREYDRALQELDQLSISQDMAIGVPPRASSCSPPPRSCCSRYENLSKGVGDTCSDVVKTKADKEQQKKEKTAEAQALEGQCSKLDASVKQLQGERNQLETDIQDKNKELQGLINSIRERDRKFGIVAAVVPILGAMINTIQKTTNDPKDKAAVESLKVQLEELHSRKDAKVSELWQKEEELIRLQLDYTKVQIDMGRRAGCRIVGPLGCVLCGVLASTTWLDGLFHTPTTLYVKKPLLS